MATKIQIKRGTKTNLPTLSPGEFGLTTDTEELYIGGNNGNIRMGKNGESSTPNATATHSGSVVAITAPAGVNLISFYAPSDFSGDDTYTVNGSAVTLTDLNGNAIYDGWKEGAPVQLILKGAQAFFKSGGGVNDTLPPLNPNMTGELADGVFTVMADKLPVSQADALAGAEWYYGDHVPARPGDGTKVEFERYELVLNETINSGATNLSEQTEGSIVTLTEDGVPVEFYIAKQNYEADLNGNNRVLLVRKYVDFRTAWYDNETKPRDEYSISIIDNYLNTTYKSKFSPAIQSLMGTTKFYYTVGDELGAGGNAVSTLERSVFALSNTEIGVTSSIPFNVEGSLLPISNEIFIAKNKNGEAKKQWLRTISTTSGSVQPFSIWSSPIFDGSYVTTYTGTDTQVVQAAFTLPGNTKVNPDGSIVELDPSNPTTTIAIEWTSSSYIYVRQFPYNSKHQYQTQLVGAVATNDPDYGDGSIAPGIPDFSYTGNYAIIDDGDGNKRVKFYTSGTLVMSKTCVVDAFYVGGGSGGASQASKSGFAPGGGGGYTATHHSITLKANTEYVITIGAGGVGTRTLTPSNGGETSAFGFSISGGQGANGGSGGGATGLSGDNNHNAEGGDGGSNGLGGEKAYRYTASTSGTSESTTQGTGQGTTTAEFGEEGNELYSGGGGGAGLWTDGGSTRRAIGGNGGAGGETNSGGIGGNTNSWDGASGNAVSNGIGGQGGKISRPSSSDYHPAGGGGGGGYGGGGGAGACGRGSTGQGGDGYHGIVIIRNHREAS